jgi:hypothetical protein
LSATDAINKFVIKSNDALILLVSNFISVMIIDSKFVDAVAVELDSNRRVIVEYDKKSILEREVINC